MSVAITSLLLALIQWLYDLGLVTQFMLLTLPSFIYFACKYLWEGTHRIFVQVWSNILIKKKICISINRKLAAEISFKASMPGTLQY